MKFDTPREIVETWPVVASMKAWAQWIANRISRTEWERKNCPHERPDWQAINEAFSRIYEFSVQCTNTIEITCPKVSIEGAQDGEDAILAELLPDHGTYLDIGAGEPQECSNTWSLYKRGWRGVLVEPLPWRVPLLALHRPGDQLCPAAIMDYDGFVKLRVAGSCSSTVSTWAIKEYGVLMSPCMTMQTLCERYQQVLQADYVSIDVEGAESAVLKRWPWDRLRPRAISVEHVTYNPDVVGDDVSQAWIGLITEHGYEQHAKTKFNMIFRRTSDADPSTL